jgi:uncharacterized protein YukE
MATSALDSPSPWAGIRIAEDVEQIAAAVRDRNWVDASLGVAGGGLDGLATMSDPAGALAQFGVAWLIEHVKPLSEALDRLAGDPSEIAGHARTWQNVAICLYAEEDALSRAIRLETAQWSGAAADAYRAWVTRHGQPVRTLADAARALATMAEGAGALVGAVRLMVRDAIAAVVARLTVYAGELLATGGLATPLVAAQVAALCASWAARIARWLRELIASLRRLVGEGNRLAELVASLKKWLDEGRGGSGGDSGQ